jgi:RNA methyltransferase, TrmH family
MITSPANPTIKQIRALRQRKAREETNQCFIEGIRLVGEAIQSGAVIEQLIVAPDLLTSTFAQELVAEQARMGTSYLEVSAAVFESLSAKDGPQGIAAVVGQRWHSLATLPPPNGIGYIALDAIADPGNLGTIIRTADAVGSSGVILLGNTTDPYDPAALRGSMGALFAQPLARSSFAELQTWARQQGLMLIGTSDRGPTHFQQAHYNLPAVLLMGSEREGLTVEQQEACDLVVHIPMHGRSDSLNLAVATGVMAYELLRQRGQNHGNAE